jgi:hypothetical protein
MEHLDLFLELSEKERTTPDRRDSEPRSEMRVEFGGVDRGMTDVYRMVTGRSKLFGEKPNEARFSRS